MFFCVDLTLVFEAYTRIHVRDDKMLERMEMRTCLKEYKTLERMLTEQPLTQPSLKEMYKQHLISTTISSRQEPLPQRCLPQPYA